MDIPSGFKLVPDETKAVTPEARGKAAAFDRWTAQGGQVGKDGVFRKGPMKGMTVDQANQKFESMWAAAPTAIKEKYASRARSGAAPSEVEEAAQRNGKTTVAKPMRPGAMYADQQAKRMAAYGHEMVNGRAERVNPAATSGAGRGEPISAKEKQAEATFKTLTPDANSQAVGNANPDGTSAEAPRGIVNLQAPFQAMGKTFREEQAKGLKTPLASAAKAYVSGAKSWASELGAAMTDSPSPSIKPPTGPSPAASVTEVKSPQGSVFKDGYGRTFPSNPSAYPTASNPAPAPSQATSTTGLAGNTTAPRSAQMPAAAPVAKPAGSPAAKPAAASQPLGPSVMTPPSTTAVPSMLRRPEAAGDGSPVIPRPGRNMDPAVKSDNGASKVRVNSLTGLPFGYRPGDSTPQAGGAAMAQRAADSVTRQSVAAAAAPPPRATVVAPARPTALQSSGINRPRTVTTGVEGRAADEMRRQAEINANPSTVNPDDPRKFFTGKVKPLTQLVAAR